MLKYWLTGKRTVLQSIRSAWYSSRKHALEDTLLKSDLGENSSQQPVVCRLLATVKPNLMASRPLRAVDSADDKKNILELYHGGALAFGLLSPEGRR